MHDPDCAQAMVCVLHEATRRSGQGPSGRGHHNCSQTVIVSTSEDGLCVEGIVKDDYRKRQGDALVILLGRRQVLDRYSNNLRRRFLITWPNNT